jgi:uncharacterized membrane protein YjjP (DUF1212 family)
MKPEILTTQPIYEKADLYLDLAIVLYEAGATVQRVSDSVRWLARSFGDETVHLFIGYEAIELSVHQRDHLENRLYVLREPSRVNVSVLHEVSRLLHRLPAYHGDVTSIREDILRMKTAPLAYPLPVILIMTSIACSAFGWINHADIPALWVIAVSAMSGLLIRHQYGKSLNNLYVSTLLTALTGGLCAALLMPLSQTKTPEIALISSVLFLIPGALLINGGLDIIRDHTYCGIARLTSVFTQICIISGALLIPLSIMDLPLQPALSDIDPLFGILYMSVAAGIAALGFATLFNAPHSVLFGCIICGSSARVVRETGMYIGFDPFLSILVGMVLATLLASVIGRYAHVPEVLLAVIAGIPMVPGLAMIQGLQGIFTIAHLGSTPSEAVFLYAMQRVLFAVVTSLALIGGIIFPILLIARKKMRI